MSIVNGSLQIAGGNNAWHTTYAAEIPLARQIVINTQTGQYKIGDGSTALSGLTYYGGAGAAWGSITGTLSNQTDLQNALNAKLDSATAALTYQPLDSDLTSWASVTRASGFDTFATTPSSANLASLVTGETGSGALVFGTQPTFTTDITTPKVIGGTGITSKITYTGSSNATPTSTSIAHEFYVGNNGASEAMRILHNRNIGININPSYQLQIGGNDSATDGLVVSSTTFVNVPNLGTVSNTTLLNARGVSVATDSTVLTGSYIPTFGIGLASNRSGALLGIKNTASNGYSILIEDGNMGIFTTTPRTELQVAGNITTTWANSSFGTWYNDGSSYRMGFNTVISSRQTNIHAYTADTGGFITFSNGTVASPQERMRVGVNGNISIGSGALATNSTDGFLYITSCPGVPTGTPTTITGRIPLVVDSTNNKMYIYSGGSWVALN